MDFQLKLELCILSFIIAVVRILFLIHKITTGYSRYYPKRQTPCKTIICVGSGGHTTEMIRLMTDLDFNKYSPRYYIMASNDTTSLSKIEEFERYKAKEGDIVDYNICKIPRSRIVNQSYITSVFTTIYSIVYSIPIVLRIIPDLILCNGPGTCIPVCGLGFLLKAMFIKDTKIVFVESFCRTRTFSLSGKILIYIADNFLVQWPSLKKKLKRAEYIGQLM